MNLKLKLNFFFKLNSVARERSRRLRIGFRVPQGGARATQKGVRLRAHEFEIKFNRQGAL